MARRDERVSARQNRWPDIVYDEFFPLHDSFCLSTIVQVQIMFTEDVRAQQSLPMDDSNWMLSGGC